MAGQGNMCLTLSSLTKRGITRTLTLVCPFHNRTGGQTVEATYMQQGGDMAAMP